MVETSYLYCLLTSSIMQEIFSTQTNGASQQFVGLNFMRRYSLIVPSYDILEIFAKKSFLLSIKRTYYIKSTLD